MLGNFVLLEVFHMGIGASAFSLVFSEFVAVLMFIPHFHRDKSLCRFVMPRKEEGDPSLLSILKPGTPMAIMYLMFTIQMIVQNLVLAHESGTSGLGNSAVVDNLVLFLTILSGTIGTLSNIPGGFDYRESISPWFRSVLMLD